MNASLRHGALHSCTGNAFFVESRSICSMEDSYATARTPKSWQQRLLSGPKVMLDPARNDRASSSALAGAKIPSSRCRSARTRSHDLGLPKPYSGLAPEESCEIWGRRAGRCAENFQMRYETRYDTVRGQDEQKCVQIPDSIDGLRAVLDNFGV